ncbi:helix-turn-helix transcriptional regulator [Actinoplanes sp. NPDC049596]|uniref:helix-turn-helix domain-containing protein n=1 Tax=unclassified Actinoplanes TaxID=2626549 RepID=UPI0034362488
MNLIGDFLRARRAQVRPEDAGLHVTGVRRVAGLRREEVALLAGVSSDYYLRLEQGRDRNPSVQVLESLARVLQLDDDAIDYLIGLAAPKPKRRRRPRRETVPAGVRELLGTLNVPAFVEGRYFDVLAANDLAVALSPRMRAGENRLRAVFLDPAERALFPDWDEATALLVAGFRESVGTDTDDPRFIELVGELSLGSERFRQLWARHDVHTREGGPTEIDHPQVGRLTLRREKLIIAGDPGQVLAVYHASPGSPSAEKLSLLASSAVTESRRKLPA